MKLKRVFMVAAVVWSVFSPLVILGGISVMEAAAEDAVCQSGSPIIAFGRRRWCGYFKNERNTSGEDVRIGGIPGSINTVDEFIALIKNDLGSSNAQRKTAAQFLILTMIERPPGPPQSVSGAQLIDWEKRVRSYASTSENGSSSFGPNGRIDWFVSQHMNCSSPQNINTFYQVPENDVAPFLNTASNSECEKAWIMEAFVIFRNTSGTAMYTIRRECMNPMGNILGLDEEPQLDYNLVPNIIATVNGVPVSGVAELGDTLQFRYEITNNDDDPSPSANCAIYGNTHVGYFPTPSPPTGSSSGGYVPPPTGCPRVFGAHTTTPLNSESFVVGSGNQTICRSLFVSPSSPTLPSLGTEVCIPIGTKPYVGVYGGDISAGNGFLAADVCTSNANASIASWNKRAAGNFAGAATQFAAYALASIIDFATSLGNGGASAAAPTGLSFANTATNPPTNIPGGLFGGLAGSLPCIPDHFATKPGDVSPLPVSVAAIASSGAYERNATGNFGGGQVDVGERISAYIEGDVLITSDITYANNFNTANAPLFRLVVKGNIFVGKDVTRLDGVYVAQKDTADGGGAIHTCATTTAALTLDGTLFNTCNKKLTVNGAFIADRVLLLRTIGSLSQSVVGESSSASPAAEVFNFGPAIWMAQPVTSESTSDYEAIISLPPIL